MTRKTGSKTFKARQLMKSARIQEQLRKLREEGIDLKPPSPSREVAKEKEREFEELFLELAETEEGPKEETSEGEEAEGE